MRDPIRRKRRSPSYLHLAFTRERGVTQEEKVAQMEAHDPDRRRQAILDLAAKFLLDTTLSQSRDSKPKI
jgi:hypothetical protein